MDANASQPGMAAMLGAGEKVGHYRVIEQLGAGGTSIVYRAHDDLLDREVAVKQVRLGGEADEDALRRRVRAEAQMQKQAAGAQPERLVQLLEVLDEPRGLFLVSEFVDGVSLEQELTRQPEPMDLKRAIGIVAATAQGLEAIHQRSIVHRDLKPANILLPRAGGLKLADFGLATAMSEQQLQSAGSVRYMAPELLRGEEADGRADLYALGLIAYEMLIGRRQFEQAFRMVLRDQRNQAMRWVKWHTNPRVKATPVTKLRSDVPPAIAELVERLMEKEADARVPTARDVLEAIRRHYAGGGAQAAAGPPVAGGAGGGPAVQAGGGEAVSAAGDTAPVPRRSRMPLVLGCVLGFWLLVAAGLGAYIFQQYGVADSDRGQAAQQMLGDAEALYQAGEYDAARERYAQIVDAWDAESQWAELAEAGVLLSRGRLYLERGEYDAARADLSALQAMDVFDPDRVRALLVQAEERGEFAAAMEAIEGQVAEARFNEARQLLREWRDVALTEAEEQRLNELSARLEDQRAQYERDQLLAEVEQLVESGRRDEAIERLGAALERGPSVRLQQRFDELRTAQRYDNLIARAEAAATGDIQDAIAHYTRAQQIEERESVAERLNALRSQAELERGLRLLEEGRAAEAEAALLRSLRYEDNPQAREALERVEWTNRRQSFIADGDEAFEASDYEAAIQQYTNAMEIEGGADVREKLERARLHRLLEQSQQAIDQQELAAAEELVERMTAIEAADETERAAVEQAQRRLEMHQQYHEHLEAGDDARARSQFGDARRHYRAAREVLDTEEVNQRLAEAEFDDAIAKARAYLEMRELDSARAWLRTAANYREEDDEQVATLRRRIEEAAESVTR